MPVYEVCLAITSYAYIDIEADSPTDAMRVGVDEWEAYKHDADNPELTGVGWQDAEGVIQMEPV